MAADDDPWLRLLRLWTLDRDRGPGHVTRGLRGWEPPPEGHPDRSRALCLAAALRATEALRTDDPALARHALEAATLLPGDAPWLEFVVASVLQAAYRMSGEPEAVRRGLELLGRVGDRTDLPELAVQARALAGNLHMLQGRFHRADDLLASSLELARILGREDGAERGMALQFRAYLRVEWNRLDEARDLLLQAVEAGEAVGSRGILSGSYRKLMEVGLATGDEEEARRWLGRLEALLEGPLSERNREWLAGVRTRFMAATGDARGAADAVRARGYRPRELARADAPVLLARLAEMSTLMEVLAVLERWEALWRLAARVREVAGGAGRRWYAVRAGGWEAAALEAMGRARVATDVLEAVLPTVEEEGYVRVLADLGRTLVPVLERAVRREPAAGATGRVLAAARVHASGARSRPSLTPRQAEVLGLLARGRSTKAIARELDLSTATVKTHLHHLYRKLGVSSRTQALARAESLALL